MMKYSRGKLVELSPQEMAARQREEAQERVELAATHREERRFKFAIKKLVEKANLRGDLASAILKHFDAQVANDPDLEENAD